MKFKVGDRVQRRFDVDNKNSHMMRGVVTQAWSEPGYPELYRVEWDEPERIGNYEYLPHGLDRETG